MPKTPFSIRTITGFTLLLIFAGFSPTLSGQEAAPASEGSSWALGQVASEGVAMQDFSVPPGSTLTSDSLLRTGERPATLHLRGGQVLRLASHSSAYFEAAAGGAVRMDVRSGSATLRGTEAEPVTVTEDMHALFSRDGRSRVAYRAASLSLRDDAAPLEQVGSGTRVGAPSISGAEKECIPDEPYPVLDALIRPSADVRVAKVYFRAAQHPDFYVVEMQGIGDDFEAILPAPAPETRQVVYFVEAVSTSFQLSRTDEFTADVIDGEQCEDRGGAAIFAGGDPAISVLSTVPGAPAFPPGFISTSSQGAALVAGGGGGLSPWAIGGIVAGSVVGGIVLIEELDEDEKAASPITP